MRECLTWGVLLLVKGLSRLFYRCELSWIGEVHDNPWKNVRLILLLNHTSLFEPLFAGCLPNRFLKEIAQRGVVPIASKTLRRPVVGLFFKRVAKNVILVTRKRDRTWQKFLAKIQKDTLVIMFPEGRMKRPSGLDLDGHPMTVRGGVADVLLTIQQGRILIAYSGGLHHVQVPNQLFPKIFKTIRICLETLDIAQYRRSLLWRGGRVGFKNAVIRDLETRRDCHCPAMSLPGGNQCRPPFI